MTAAEPREPILGENDELASKVRCYRCGKRLPFQFGMIDMSGDYQFDNNAIVEFAGGYGMFHDDIGEGPYQVNLCHECGHELCDWLGVNPNSWHTHSSDSGQHGDHHERIEY